MTTTRTQEERRSEKRFLTPFLLKTITNFRRIAMTRTVTILSALLTVLGITAQSHGDLVFSTGFNGNTNRDAGTAGTATIVGSPTGFSFQSDTVGGSPDTVIQVDEVASANFVDLTGTGVTGDIYTVVFDAKVSFSSGFQTLIGPPGGDQDIFIRSTGQGGIVDVGSNGSSGAPSVNDGAWHRIVVTSGVGGIAALYVDGIPGTLPVGTTTDDPLTASIGLFRDDSNDNKVGSRFANFALYDNAISSTEAIALGSAGSQVIGVIIPEPSTLVLAALGLLGLLGWGWRRRM